MLANKDRLLVGAPGVLVINDIRNTNGIYLKVLLQDVVIGPSWFK